MIERESFGQDGLGNSVEAITISNQNDTRVKIASLGATIVSFARRDKNGKMQDIVLGYDDVSDYLEQNEYYFGATVGRNANRISGAKLTIGGVEYTLEANSGGNNLHSGSNGISHRVWEVAETDEKENTVTFQIFSGDLEQGFPGNMTIRTTFRLTEDDALHISYEAVSDRDTIANFTNHSYFNLSGHDSGYIGRQKLKIYADEFTPLTQTGSIPTGEIRPVKGTPLDFTEFKAFDGEFDSDYDQIVYVRGFDHNFLLKNNGKLELMAEAVSEETGMHLYAYTDCPGVQLYTGNFIKEHRGKAGAVYKERHGFCLEAQYVPDAPNQTAFVTPLLKAGDVYRSETVYRLTLDNI